MLLAGLGKGQTIGLRYGQSGTTEAIGPARSQVAGIYAEQPLGQRFSLSTGLNYLWFRDASSSDYYFLSDCAPWDGSENIAMTGWRQKSNLLEVPVDIAYGILGKNSSCAQLRLTTGISYIRELSYRETWYYEDGSQYILDRPHSNDISLKIGLEERLRWKQLGLAIGLQFRRQACDQTSSSDYGAAFLYLKAGWQLRKRAVI